MARKKTQQKEELTSNEEQVVVDQADEKDPWDGYLSESTEQPASDDSYFSIESLSIDIFVFISSFSVISNSILFSRAKSNNLFICTSN